MTVSASARHSEFEGRIPGSDRVLRLNEDTALSGRAPERRVRCLCST